MIRSKPQLPPPTIFRQLPLGVIQMPSGHPRQHLGGPLGQVQNHPTSVVYTKQTTTIVSKEAISRAKQNRQPYSQGESEGGVQGNSAPSRGQGSETEGEGQEQRSADQRTGNYRPVDLCEAARWLRHHAGRPRATQTSPL